ncbi:hypothetical protein HF086_010621 [Spodoptera exigua]|uniref:Uncharacterized protein n=1 Tax=Spodoptera exigua TaxID=7107 RepID=A0A922MUT1_SPOEX|nr:hypothetical protein HF086_010621 [Spodoptera exigua]
MSINLDEPKFDQKTYWGRAKHFILLTNPLNAFASDKSLNEAKRVVDEFRKTKRMPQGYDEEKLWAAKYLYDSAFHPDTGEKMVRFGRMSAQAPMNTIVTGCEYFKAISTAGFKRTQYGGMITFYKTKPAIIFWQWFNQTFNAVVNYTNRSGDAVITTK